MVIEQLMKRMSINPVPRKTSSIHKHPTLTFGAPLQDVIERDKTEIPIVVSDIFNFLLDNGGLQCEGIFRVNGNSRTVEILRTVVNENGSYWRLGEFSSIAGDLDRTVDVFSVASLLKLYLRELPEGLIPENVTASFLKIYSEYGSKQDLYLIQLENLIAQLPVFNYTLLKHLCQFLHRVSVHQSENKMSTESLGIVFGPNVFRFTPEKLNYREQNSVNDIMTTLIEYSNNLFRMIAPRYENVSILNDNLSGNNYTQIHQIPFNETSVQSVRNKIYSTSESLSSMESCNDAEEYVGTESPTQSTTKVETNHMRTRQITNTYCNFPQTGIKNSTTAPATTAAATTKTTRNNVSELTKINDIVDTNDNQFKHKSSTCDIISTYLEIAIRSCIQEHLFQESFSETVNNSNHSFAGINQIAKSDYTEVNLSKINYMNHANLKNSETNYSNSLSTTNRTNESNEQILNRLNHYLYNFKSRLREYENLFEQDYGRKPTDSDKYSNPKISELLCQVSEVQTAIKQIKSGKISDSHTLPNGTIQNGYSSAYTNSIDNNTQNGKLMSSASLVNHCPGKQSFSTNDNEVKDHVRDLRSPNKSFSSKSSIIPNMTVENENLSKQSDLNKPTIESTCLMLSKRLTEKRLMANRPEDLHLMTPKQIAAEKLAIQKALLFFESLHGRPKEHQDRITMRPLYDRYRSVKRLLNCLQSNNNFIEENSDMEVQSSLPSTDDHLKLRSAFSPNTMPIINDSSSIQQKSIHSTGTTSNSTWSLKSTNPVSYPSSLQSPKQCYNPMSSISNSNNTHVPPVMSSSTSTSSMFASSNPAAYSSSITSSHNTVGNNDHHNDRLDVVAQKYSTVVTSISSTVKCNSTGSSNPVERSTCVNEKQNVNYLAHDKQPFKFNSNVDSHYNELDCDTKRMNDRNSRVPCSNKNEWFGTIGLSKRNQDNGNNDYHVTNFDRQSQLYNERNLNPPVENTVSVLTHTSTRSFDSLTYSNRHKSEFSSPIHQENFVGANKLSYFSPPPPISLSSFSNSKIIQANNISNTIHSNTNNNAIKKNRRRILATSENATDTALPRDKSAV
ncbi:unnamed protein product [Schistosoma turkestanicum]|nr:unnamed protein product [Schistosoma turkestanicum]